MRAGPAATSCCPPAKDVADLRPIEGSAADEELAGLAKALGHPARVKILRILVRSDACICGDIVEELPLAHSTVSQHLKVLKDAGLKLSSLHDDTPKGIVTVCSSTGPVSPAGFRSSTAT